MGKKRVGKIGFLAPIIIGLLAFPSLSLAGTTPPDKFVRTADYYLKAGVGIPSSDYDKLAKYDVLVLPAEAQVFNPGLFTEVRKQNPNIIILAYVPTKSYALVWNDPLHGALKQGIKDEWRLRDREGKELSVWPNTFALNVGSGWSEYLPQFVHDRILSTGLWDGIFYDEASATISWLNGGDVGTTDQAWKAGMIKILKTTQASAATGTIVIMNGDSDADLQPYVNGRMFESFPTPWEGNGSWSTVEGTYLRLQKQVASPPIFLINGDTNNTGAKDDYAKMRFGLTSALLGDGYFGFDFGTQDHGQIWTYDEYGAYLGRPLGGPKDLTSADAGVRPGLWRRDFQNGIVLVNSTASSQSADLSGEYEHLHGAQDPAVNDGTVVSSVDVPASDGVILLRPLDHLDAASYRNGTFVRILDGDGAAKRTGFFAYTKNQRGGTIVADFDVAGLGKGASLAAKDNHLDAYDLNGVLQKTVYPFGQAWKPNIGFSIGTAGGTFYVAAASGAGGPPRVRLYDDQLNPIGDAWDAYAPFFKGGVNVAVGDFDGDGRPDVVTGAGAGGGPHVRVFDQDHHVLAQFFAYDPKSRSGVNIGIGDVDGDGRPEIITGTGFGASPDVRVFSRRGQLIKKFYAFDSRQRAGVRVSATDVDGDGRYEILAMSNGVFL